MTGAHAEPAAAFPTGVAHSARPMSYLQTAGPAADPITALNWGLSGLSILVTLIITGLVVAGVLRRRSRAAPDSIATVEVERRGDGVRWIWIGISATSVALLVSLFATVASLGAVAHPRLPVAYTIEVTGEQWWWRAKYLHADPRQTFVTANEIHIPVGRPVRFKLMSGDVIHSFWVPALGGKTDLIPGRVNYAWLQADRAGRYRGQCVEYCGQQHAQMILWVVADEPAEFERWRANQLRPALPPATSEAAHGRALLTYRCGACHTVRGTEAGGRNGPDLTHLMSRQTIAAGAAPNTIGALSGWIANPQTVKPGTRMPTLYVSGRELADLRAYLLTLR